MRNMVFKMAFYFERNIGKKNISSEIYNKMAVY